MVWEIYWSQDFNYNHHFTISTSTTLAPKFLCVKSVLITFYQAFLGLPPGFWPRDSKSVYLTDQLSSFILSAKRSDVSVQKTFISVNTQYLINQLQPSIVTSFLSITLALETIHQYTRLPFTWDNTILYNLISKTCLTSLQQRLILLQACQSSFP